MYSIEPSRSARRCPRSWARSSMTSLATNDFRSAAGFMALQSLPRVGPVTALNATLHSTQMEQLLERYGSEIDVAFDLAQRRLADYADADVRLVSFFDERYPDRLRNLSDPRRCSTCAATSSCSLASGWLRSSVRVPTVFGISAAENMTGALADRGWGIVSGLAKGIDTIAHRTALEHGAPTIAVMGGGLDSVYPAENRGLAARIVEEGGALISEQPFGEQPRPPST